MVQLASALAIGVLGLASVVSAHPGHDHKAEAAERALYMRNAPIQSRSLSQCASQMKARGLESKNVARRAAAVKNLRRRRGLKSGTQNILNLAGRTN
jgi:hypothetical protein